MTATAPPLFVVGAGGHAKVVIAALEARGENVVGVLDDDAAKHGSKILGVSVVGACEELDHARADAVLAIGDNATRKQLAGRLAGVTWRAVVHPRAIVHTSVRLGEGSVVLAGAVVQPDATIGPHAIVNTAASVDHDCELGAFVHLAPGVRLAGDVVVEEGAFVGIGASVLPGRRIGAWSTVGAGAVVVDDVPPGAVSLGVPARPREGRRRT